MSIRTISLLAYNEDFEDNSPIQWFNAPQRGANTFNPTTLEKNRDPNTGNYYITSTGPFWLDENHAGPTGAGYLNLLLFGYTGTLIQKGSLNLLDASFNCQIKMSTDFIIPSDARVCFWFQSYDPSLANNSGRWVNYLYTSAAIAPGLGSGSFSNIHLSLSGDDKLWTALHSSPYRTATYSRSPKISDALSLNPVDFGIFLYSPTSDIMNINGSISFDNISIVNGSTHYFRSGQFKNGPKLLNLGVNYSDNSVGLLSLGSLVVDFKSGGGRYDQLGLYNQDAGTGQGLGLLKNNVIYNGSVFGTITGGYNGSALVIKFNSNVSINAVQSVLDNLTYMNSSSNPIFLRTISLKITGSDGISSNSITAKIQISPDNKAPVLANPIPALYASNSQNWTYTVPSNTFSDDNPLLTYTATLADGSALPSWMFFNNQLAKFTGNPTGSTKLSIKINATDGQFLASDIFSVNFIPVVSIIGKSENETLNGQSGAINYIYDSGPGGDILNGSMDSPNYLYGGLGSNTLRGGSCNDQLFQGRGTAMMAGGTGDDVYYVNAASASILENSNSGYDTVVTSAYSYTLSANIEALILSDNAIRGFGSSSFCRIIGNRSNNVLSDGGIQSSGASLEGGLGDDTYYVNSRLDQILEAAQSGYDVVSTTLDNFTLPNNVEGLKLTGNSTSGIGNDSYNVIYGNKLSSTLIDGSGGAYMIGQSLSGGDKFVVRNKNTFVVEKGLSNGSVVESYVDFVLPTNIESLTLNGSGLRGSGNSYDNLIITNGVNNIIAGGAGSDTFGFTNKTANGTTIISDFNEGADFLKLSSIFSDASSVISSSTQVGSDVYINTSAWGGVDLQNVNLQNFAQTKNSWFI